MGLVHSEREEDGKESPERTNFLSKVPTKKFIIDVPPVFTLPVLHKQVFIPRIFFKNRRGKFSSVFSLFFQI